MAATSKDISSSDRFFERRRPTDFGLVVGVDHYPRFRSLQGAIADARRFHAWMCERDGGGVEPHRATLILSTPEPATPVHSQIDEALGRLMAEADALGGGRRLYFYFSGHGATCLGGPCDDVALLLATWSRNFARTALSSRAYKSELATIGLFEELAIFLDCCRCASERVVGLPPTMTPQLVSTPFPTREFVAYATEARRSAFEIHDDQLWQGVFTQHLISILRRSANGIRSRDLKDMLECEIAAVGQQVHIVNELHHDSVFGHRNAPPHIEIRFKESIGRVRLRDGELKIIAEHEASPEPWHLVLEAGLYKLEGGQRAPLMFQHGNVVTYVDF